MSSSQEKERQNRKEWQKLVEYVAFHLLTVPKDWRYSRDNDWEVGQAINLKNFIKRNTGHLFNKFQDPNYATNFSVPEDEHYEAELEIFQVLTEMFPTIDCLHGDDRDDMITIFIPRLHDIKGLFA